MGLFDTFKVDWSKITKELEDLKAPPAGDGDSGVGGTAPTFSSVSQAQTTPVVKSEPRRPLNVPVAPDSTTKDVGAFAKIAPEGVAQEWWDAASISDREHVLSMISMGGMGETKPGEGPSTINISRWREAPQMLYDKIYDDFFDESGNEKGIGPQGLTNFSHLLGTNIANWNEYLKEKGVPPITKEEMNAIIDKIRRRAYSGSYDGKIGPDDPGAPPPVDEGAWDGTSGSGTGGGDATGDGGAGDGDADGDAGSGSGEAGEGDTDAAASEVANRTIDDTEIEAAQSQLQELIDQLRKRATGELPSAAEMQMRQGLEQAQSQALGTARSMRGVSPGQALYTAQQAQGDLAAKTMQETGILRAQEQQQAEQTWLNAVNAMTTAEQQEVNSILQMSQANDAMIQYYLTLGFNQEQADRQANIDLEKFKYLRWLDAAKLANAIQIAKLSKPGAASIWPSIIGALGTLGGAAIGAFAGGPAGAAAGGAAGGAAATAAASDVQSKQNIQSAGPQVDQMLAQLSPYQYEYKPGVQGTTPGPKVGVMAQDLEKSPLGAQAVVPRPDGFKGIDQNTGLGLALAGLSRLNERLDSLEGLRDAPASQSRIPTATQPTEGLQGAVLKSRDVLDQAKQYYDHMSVDMTPEQAQGFRSELNKQLVKSLPPEVAILYQKDPARFNQFIKSLGYSFGEDA